MSTVRIHNPGHIIKVDGEIAKKELDVVVERQVVIVSPEVQQVSTLVPVQREAVSVGIETVASTQEPVIQTVTIGVPGPPGTGEKGDKGDKGDTGDTGPPAEPPIHSPEFTYTNELLMRIDYLDGSGAFKVFNYHPDGRLDWVDLTKDGITTRKTAVYGLSGELIALPQTIL